MVESVRPSRVGRLLPIVRDGARASGEAFAVETGAGSVQPNARLTGVPALGLESMLLLQAVDEAGQRDRSARKRGGAMIAALTDLQRALLAQEDPALALRSLSALSAEGPEAADPGLAAILRSVVLRSRIEVVRRERQAALA